MNSSNRRIAAKTAVTPALSIETVVATVIEAVTDTLNDTETEWATDTVTFTAIGAVGDTVIETMTDTLIANKTEHATNTVIDTITGSVSETDCDLSCGSNQNQNNTWNGNAIEGERCRLLDLELPLEVTPPRLHATPLVPFDTSGFSASAGVTAFNRLLTILPAASDGLRVYQRLQIAELGVRLRAGQRRIVLQLATGGGKTHEIAAIASAALRAGLRVLILATRTRLIKQICARLAAFGVRYGVIAASLPKLTNGAALVQVASADTLYRRCIKDKRRPLPSADLVVFDEAHLAAANTRLELLDSYSGIRLGFTATPARKSGRGLALVFDELLLGPPMSELVQMGVLVRPRIFNKPVVTVAELKALPTNKDCDFSPGALGKLMGRPVLIGDVIKNWLRIANGRRTVVFAVNKAHGAQLVEEFCRVGVAAELITDQNSEFEREAAITRLEMGHTSIVVNCFLMSYGIDIPLVDCIVLARPTRSLVLYLQMIGRGLRPASGKEYCIVIDHGRCVESLGLPTSDFAWSLDEGEVVKPKGLNVAGGFSIVETPRTCVECSNIWMVSESGESCDICGWRPILAPRAIATQDVNLEEADVIDPPLTINSPEVMRFCSEALGFYIARWPDRWTNRPTSGRWWAWTKTSERFKLDLEHVPKHVWHMSPVATSLGTTGWLKSRQIAWARGRGRARA
jgi:DNA repair protein RadD